MVNANPIHYIGILVSVLLVYKSYKLVRSGKENVLEFLVWLCFGLGIFALSVSTAFRVFNTLEWFQAMLAFLGFRSGRDGVFVVAILGLMLLLFYTYANAKSNQKRVSDLNQKVALLKYEVRQQDKRDSESRQSNEKRP